MTRKIRSTTIVAAAALLSLAVSAAPVEYEIDPHHTFPSFEADHMGISVWRGKMNKNSGSVVYDKATGAGRVEIEIDLDGIDFGHPQLNTWARGGDFFDVAKYPKALYQGRIEPETQPGRPRQVLGELSLHGVTRPVNLTLHWIRCVPHPLNNKRELCGADVSGSFQRDEFGLGAGKDYGFKMDVALRIQVEALAKQP
ncbi:YceI family protein [Roseateles sp. DAIF2]|uniref:YceI family protein n=1 Tax=Roseateles sp. DAIF2 TaxID=2714952 RepID=UPI0018A2DD17|nr:YceI family protein [Roseateles sp. DAIF2]QPF71518.1 YceI family protein [Roseateles sp. DAIF2]